MKILITGSKGQTGRALESQALAAGHTVMATDLNELDITDKLQVDRIFDSFVPTHVINAAAYNSVDGAEDDPDAAFAINSIAPAYLALASRRHQAVMVHYSTDYVFDGEKGGDYQEGDAANPISTYGRSKLLGEQTVLGVLSRSYIFRTSWVFGPGGNNFVSRLLRMAEPGKSLRYINDQLCSPTYAPDLASVTLGLLGRTAPFGIYHSVGMAAISPFDWAAAILKKSGLGNELLPVSMNEFKTRAARPRRAILSNTKLIRMGIRIPGGPERLDDYFNDRIKV